MEERIMAVDVKVPSVGESIVTVRILSWHVADGAVIDDGSPLLEIETDKVTMTLNAETSGKVHILAAEGEEVKVGATVATIEPGAQRQTMSAKPDTSREEKRSEAILTEVPQRALLSGERRVRMSMLRQSLSRRLVAVKNETAMLTTFNEADMTEVEKVRNQGVKLGLISFFIKASAIALKEFPDANASIDGFELVYHDFCDIGIAVSTDRGLAVPVIRKANALTLSEIEKSVAQLAEKARKGMLTIEDMSGGTFTITNGGVFGSLLSTPILNPPQCAILGMHAIQERPVARDGKVVVRPMMYLALSYDHRLLDGKGAVGFLHRIKGLIESASTLYQGV